MSQPVDISAPAPAADALAAPPVPSGAPYRVAEVPGPAELALPHRPFATPRRPRPIIGPALTVFAVLLWSFVVAGQFTTSWMDGGPMPPVIAGAIVFATTLAAWIAGIRRSRAAMPPRSTAHLVGRAIGVSVLALLLFLASIFAAAVAGNVNSRNHDFPIAFVLIVVSTVAAILGRGATWPMSPERTHRQRMTAIFLWLAGALATVIAGAELAVNG